MVHHESENQNARKNLYSIEEDINSMWASKSEFEEIYVLEESEDPGVPMPCRERRATAASPAKGIGINQRKSRARVRHCPSDLALATVRAANQGDGVTGLTFASAARRFQR